jgi:iron complex outermembrane receptor protein
MSLARGGRTRGRVYSFRTFSHSSLTVLPLALLAATPSAAETAQPSQSTELPRVTVTSPPPSGRPGARPKQAPRAPTQPAPATPVTTTPPTTPLNTNTVTEVGGPLGLTSRQTPATVEIVDKEVIREQGYRTTTDTAQGFPGVTAGDGPGAPANFSMRGFSGTQINTLYNGIKIGPSEMTNRIMDTYNLERVEILKGPASLLSGEGATAGAVNYVTKAPHTGPILNEAFTGWDSINGFRTGYGSGGSTNVKGLDYRFDISRTNLNSFIDDAYTKLFNVSGGLNYRVNDSFKVWGAVEYKEDRDRFYWGTPLVAANSPGIVPTKGIVSGRWTQYYPGPCQDAADTDCFRGHIGDLKPVTIDARTLTTNYNVLDNKSFGKELWLRGGFEYIFDGNVTLRSQAYAYGARRLWHNNEISAFNDSPFPTLGAPGQVYRERLTVDHDQRTYGNITDLSWNSRIGGMENRSVVTLSAYRTQFNVAQDTLFFADPVDLVNPVRDLYGDEKDEHIRTRVDNIALSFEDRLKITPTFALIGGIRVEGIELSRIRFNPDGSLRDGYPFSKDFTPVTGRIGYTWELLPGLTWYSQYATAADPAIANIFILRPTQPLLLTSSRIYETGVKQLFWGNRAEWTLSAYDIERNNVYQSKSGHLVNVAAKVHAKGIEIAGAVRPTDEWKLFANVALVQSKYENFVDADTGEVFTGKTPPNVPRFVFNAGTSYRFPTRWPVEVGGVVRHVGDRFNNDDNLVIMNAYTLFDAFAFVDVNPRDLGWDGVKNTRIGFRVRNLTDKKYAVWGDPGYPDQIILGAPRSFEVSAAFRW